MNGVEYFIWLYHPYVLAVALRVLLLLEIGIRSKPKENFLKLHGGKLCWILASNCYRIFF